MTNNKISNGYEDIKVDVVDYVKDIAKHAWDCYKMTWSDLQDVEYDVNNPKVQEAVRNIMFYRALPMPREQANITFKISNVSRVCWLKLLDKVLVDLMWSHKCLSR